MEDLNDINFLAVIEGRDYEHSLKKIVSILSFVHFHVFHSYLQGNEGISTNSRIFGSQGFTKFHFTPLEVLAVIEGIQLRLKRVFSAEEIESGILEDLIIESDYDVLHVVSKCAFKRYSF